jgi:hypothetical protein
MQRQQPLMLCSIAYDVLELWSLLLSAFVASEGV